MIETTEYNSKLKFWISNKEGIAHFVAAIHIPSKELCTLAAPSIWSASGLRSYAKAYLEIADVLDDL